MNSMLDIKSLSTVFTGKNGRLTAVDGMNLQIDPRETVALVGESGSGKSVTALSILRLVPPPGKITNGEIFFNGKDILRLPESEMRAIRGKEIGLILQDALSALNPVMRVGEQIAEVYRHHFRMDRKSAKIAAMELMEKVRLSNVEQLYHAYPHQLSGGMRQRALIAIALACRPKLVIADEPTTALDVSLQSQILSLLNELKSDFGLALLLITHDLAIVSQMADRVAVMYAGQILEQNETARLFKNPRHPYTGALIRSIPRIDFSGEQTFHSRPLPGNVPDLHNLPAGCVFHPRCEFADEKCRTSPPETARFANGSEVRCFNPAPQNRESESLKGQK